VQVDATHWQVNSADNLTHETIAFSDAAVLHAADWHLSWDGVSFSLAPHFAGSRRAKLALGGCRRPTAAVLDRRTPMRSIGFGEGLYP
jgi:hypothetical protein